MRNVNAKMIAASAIPITIAMASRLPTCDNKNPERLMKETVGLCPLTTVELLAVQ